MNDSRRRGVMAEKKGGEQSGGGGGVGDDDVVDNEDSDLQRSEVRDIQRLSPSNTPANPERTSGTF